MKVAVQYNNFGIQQEVWPTYSDALCDARHKHFVEGLRGVQVVQIYELSELADIGEYIPLKERRMEEVA